MIFFEKKVDKDIFKKIIQQMILSNCSFNYRDVGIFTHRNMRGYLPFQETDKTKNCDRAFNLIDSFFDDGLSFELHLDYSEHSWTYFRIHNDVYPNGTENCISLHFGNFFRTNDYDEFNKPYFDALRILLRNVHQEVPISSVYTYYSSGGYYPPFDRIAGRGEEIEYLTMPGVLKKERIPNKIFKLLEEHDIIIEDFGNGTLFFMRDYYNSITKLDRRNVVQRPDYTGDNEFYRGKDREDVFITVETAIDELGLNPKPFLNSDELNEEWEKLKSPPVPKNWTKKQRHKKKKMK